MQRFSFFPPVFWLCLACAALALSLSSCATNESYGYGSSERYVPTVRMPRNLDDSERRYIYEVEDVLTRAGYRLTTSNAADYELEFRIESGPINTDTYLTLTRDNGQEVATAYARSSGLINRQQVVRQSFEKCLIEFERQVPSVGPSYDSGTRYDRYDQGGNRYRDSYEEYHRQ